MRYNVTLTLNKATEEYQNGINIRNGTVNLRRVTPRYVLYKWKNGQLNAQFACLP